MTLPGGRRLGYAGFGDPAGLPVLHFHGALTSRWEGFWLDVAARAHGLKLVSLDRPGVGTSDFAPGRTLLDWPRDVAVLADALGLDRFAVVGISGGGPYALACAHAMPARVTRVALIAGAAPLSDPAVFAQLSLRQRMSVGRLIRSPRVLHTVLRGLRALPPFLRMFAVTAVLGGLSSADLRTVRSADITERFKLLPKEAAQAPFGLDASGPMWDGHLHSQPWGFALADIRTPVDLWYAEDDRIVSARMGRWLAGVLPDVHPRFLPDDGHLSLILGKADDYLGALRAAA